MLGLRPNCECYDTDLPPASAEAVICSFEYTFCRTCAEDKLIGAPKLKPKLKLLAHEKAERPLVC